MAKPAKAPVPEGMHTITPHLWFNGEAAAALDLYQRAFGAEVVGDVAKGPDGKSVMHAMLRFGTSHVMIADAWPGNWERGPTDAATAGLWVYVNDCDALFRRAAAAGCEVTMPVADMFWGDRMGKLKGPYGHTWAIATHKEVLTPEEIHEREQAWLRSMQGGG